ncbi:MAG: HEAT repeat domain-containing protein [Thermoplasmatales archaeon]|nr:HEAT repeat domain-containing protein [Thermoplasmatales archaeon]
MTAEKKKETEIEKLIHELKKYDKDKKYPQKNEEGLKKTRDKLISIGKPAVPELINVLNNHDSWSCYFAAEALGDINDKRAIEPLMDAFKEFGLRETAERALKKFGRICAPKAIKKIEDIIRKHTNKKGGMNPIISSTLSVIGEIQCDESINFLNRLLDDYTDNMPEEGFEITKHEWKYQNFDFFHLLDCMVRQQNKKAIPFIKKARDQFPENYTDYKICQIAIGRIKKERVEGYLPMEALEIMMPSGAIMNALSGGELGWKDTFDEEYGEYFEDDED